MAAHTGEVGLAKATDTEIAERALREGQTIVTLDADFHALLATRNARAPSVLRVRIERLRGEQDAALIERVVGLCEADLLGGAMVTVDGQAEQMKKLGRRRAGFLVAMLTARPAACHRPRPQRSARPRR